MTNLASAFLSSAAAVAELGGNAAGISELDDVLLMAGQKAYVSHQRHMETYGAWIAGEIARRSTRELGFSGLAKREGFPTPEALIQSVTGGSIGEASKLVKVGVMMAEVEEAAAVDAAVKAAAEAATALLDDPDVDVPFDPITLVVVSPDAGWQAPIVSAVADGSLSVDQAESIRKGLGVVDNAITGDMLRAAVEELLTETARGNANRMYRRARELRDALDIDGVAAREKERRDLQFITARLRDDGMVTGSYAFANEDGALWFAAYNQALSPRLGGPRMVDTEQRARDEAITNDPRSRGQIAADIFVGLLRLGIDADPGVILGTRHPSVRVIVEEKVLVARAADPDSVGTGRIEGMIDAISLATIERALCDTGVIGIKFDQDGQCVDLGRDQRLFSSRQKAAMAVRDGGCMAPHCDRPPSFTEAHHIVFWKRDKGKTDIADGILLCRYHHMLFHNNGWEVLRDGGTYCLKPPKSIDARQRLIPMPSKNPTIRAISQANRRAWGLPASAPHESEPSADPPTPAAAA
jgi:hypothetical protein